jgi:hypothetical protein
VAAQIFFDYRRYASILKWLTLSLFAYVIALAAVKVPWGEALRGIFIPSIQLSGDYLTTLVASWGPLSHLISSSGNRHRKSKNSASIQPSAL